MKVQDFNTNFPLLYYYYYLYFCILIHNEETLSGSLLVELEFSKIRMEVMTPHPLIVVCGDSLS